MKRALERRTLFKRLPLYPALALAGIALAVLGFYAPWVTSARGLAALTYNAIDLAELCKFITRAGIANLTREWFLAPITAAALALALWANSPAGTAPLSSRLRYALTLLAAALALVPLPPLLSGMSPSEFITLVAYRSVEDRALFWLSIAGFLGVLLIFVFGRRMAGRWNSARGIVWITFALFGLVLPAWEFFARAMPAISKVNGSPAVLGWGMIVMLIGFGLTALGGLLLALEA